jgi:hypothetical protein
MAAMDVILQEERFDYLSGDERAFVLAMDAALAERGYTCGGQIGEGYCWGRHMLIYRKAGAKSERVYARLYLREADVVLRLFFNGVDRHRAYLEVAPDHIQEVFTGPFGDCEHCHNQGEDGACRFRKRYTLHGREIAKCNGNTFWFFKPTLARLDDYLALFDQFYPPKRR